MIRIVELVVALIIVFLLAVGIGAILPEHGHIERSIEVSSPIRTVFDTVNTLRRFPQWSAMRNWDPQVQMTVSGPDSGKDSKVTWTSAKPMVGDGSLEIASSEQDSKVNMSLQNDWIGTNKTFTVQLNPSSNGKTVAINWAYDVDYGWNLMARYGGLYINGDPASEIRGSLANLAALLAGFPNTDYSDQQIAIADVAAQPVLLVSTKAKRTLDDVSDATNAALTQIADAIKKLGVNVTGPFMTITTDWGEDDYTFSVAVPIDAATLTLNGQSYTLETPVRSDEGGGGDDNAPAMTLNPGDKDSQGMLVVEGNVRAATWYQGQALVSEYTGSPASLPLLRLNLKAYAETHGYHYNESGLGRFWDEDTSPDNAPDDQHTFKVFLPIQK